VHAGSTESAQSSGDCLSLAEKFRQLTNEWKQNRGFSSSLSVVKNDPSYQEIIRMGRSVLPFIMDELEKRPDFWFAALREITGENPVLPENAGRLHEMAAVWLQWGRANNVRW